MRPGTKPKANIKSMFMAQAAATTKRKPEVGLFLQKFADGKSFFFFFFFFFLNIGLGFSFI